MPHVNTHVEASPPCMPSRKLDRHKYVPVAAREPAILVCRSKWDNVGGGENAEGSAGEVLPPMREEGSKSGVP